MELLKHEDYKEYLRERIRAMPRKGRGEVQRIAKALRVHPSFISQVLRGSNHLTGEQALALAAHWGLAEGDTDYFLLLVQHQRASTPALKHHFHRKIVNFREQIRANREEERREFAISRADQSIFYSDWHYSAIRLAASPGTPF